MAYFQIEASSPEFVIRLRSHTVWERMNVKLSCIVQGVPSPQVKWYKDGYLIEPTAVPGKYTIENKIGLQTLEISRYLFLIVDRLSCREFIPRRWYSNHRSNHLTLLLPVASPVELDVDIVDGFEVSFAQEDGSLVLVCTFSSPLPKHQQDISWFRDGDLLVETDCLGIECTDYYAKVTLSDIHKEDEGLYTIRLPTLDGHKEHSAYVFVRDGPAAVTGAPGSPLDVQGLNVNQDYVFVTWKPPSADGGSPVLGYFVERCEEGSESWIQCNDVPEKLCKLPVLGLCENTSYQFRVLAVNSAGVSRPSKVSEPVTTTDPTIGDRIMTIQLDRGKIVISKDELEGEVCIPLPPTNVHITEVGQTYIALCWNEPCPRGREPLKYYVEKSVAGSGSWQRVNLEVPVSCPRFAVFDLDRGKQYCFRVRAVNKYGISEPSEPSRAVSHTEILAAPSPPYAIIPTRNTKTSVLVQWQAEDTEEPIGFYVYVCEIGTNNWEICNNKPVTSKRLVVHDLKPGKKYVFRVKSANPAGLSDYSNESTPIEVNNLPSAPYGLVQLTCGKNEMVIGWKEPKFLGGREILGYFLDCHDLEDPDWHEVNINPITTRIYKVRLTEGHFYEFRAFAMNWAGVGAFSETSDQFKCEEWTMAQPGPPFDVTFTEVRRSSLVVLWQPPLYTGQSPVTGYFVDVCEIGSDEWMTLNEEPTLNTHFKVSDLKGGRSYMFRVFAINSAGAGQPSLPSDPVIAETRRGTTDVEAGVDDEGNIFLAFQCPEFSDGSRFIWSKSYQEITSPERAQMETKGNTSKLIFTDPSEDDLGTYSVEATNTGGASSSYALTQEELQRLKDLSYEIRNPTIALKSDWAVEFLEKGTVRLWLQTQNLSPAAQLRFIFNEKQVSSTPTHKINFDKASGLIEMIIQNFAEEDQGSYTAQLQDGRAKGQFTLVLIDEKFRAILTQCDSQRRDWKRKQGPYFEKLLHWEVTDKCDLLLSCQVTNTKKETILKWYKNGHEITDIIYNPQTGISTLQISQVTKENAGVFKTVVADDRGEDSSVLDLYSDILCGLCSSGVSASELKLQCTVEGIKLYCFMKYQMDYMKKTWYLKYVQDLKSFFHTTRDTSFLMVWVQILNPIESDRGKYTLEMFDGKQTHKRTLNLSEKGRGAFIYNKARVVEGLPDVVAIMEDKTLTMTCLISGDPVPEVFWMKNDREIVTGERYQITLQKMTVTLTIQTVTCKDSGRYSLFVRNKHGSDTANVTLSVYKHDEKPKEGIPPLSAFVFSFPASAVFCVSFL
uniref:M-protein, striated muscle-like n=1 Tax=Callorhinchus milii TaxID=7868 RepID=A0A4W3J4X9_CALMI